MADQESPPTRAQPSPFSPPPQRLWTFKDYADFLAVSERTLHEMEAQGLLAEPVVLGPRLKRYVPAECEALILSMPRSKLPEPERFAAARRARSGGAEKA